MKLISVWAKPKQADNEKTLPNAVDILEKNTKEKQPNILYMKYSSIVIDQSVSVTFTYHLHTHALHDALLVMTGSATTPKYMYDMNDEMKNTRIVSINMSYIFCVTKHFVPDCESTVGVIVNIEYTTQLVVFIIQSVGCKR